MARKVGFWPLQKAIYTRLTTHALTSGYRIYNYTPKGTALPYVVVGEKTGTRKGARDHTGEENAVTVHVWTEHAGEKTADEMMDAVVQALTGSALSLTDGYAELYCLLDFADCFRDDTEPERDIWHGVLRFRYWLETAS
jgi:hypothetical protein